MNSETVYADFENWLLKVLKKEKPKPEIIAFNLGIFKTKVSYTVYLMGSREYDPDDSDWACSQNYFPADRYFDFPKEYAKDKDTAYIENEVITFAKNFSQRDEYKSSFLAKAHALTVGFDDGDLHTITTKG